MSKRKNNKKQNNGVRILPISIIIFVILSAIALFIILNKGKIGSYSLVKIETSTDSVEESVEEPEDKMEIAVEKKFLSFKSKEQEELTVLVNGEEIDISEVQFESSNDDVIEVEDGIAKAISVGKATITAKKDDLEATVDLRCIIPIKSINFTTTNSIVKVGKSLQMKLVAKPSDANIESLKYESSDEKIATVNSNGIVTGVSPGNVTITVTDLYNEIEKSLKLTIRK